MVVAPSGEVVGTGGGRVFVFSPAKMEVTHTAPNSLGDFTHMCVAPDGKLYGINPSRIGRIVPGSWRVESVAAEGGKFLAADRAGRLYFGRGSRVLRLSPREALRGGQETNRHFRSTSIPLVWQIPQHRRIAR
jgi:hypothetical protein